MYLLVYSLSILSLLSNILVNQFIHIFNKMFLKYYLAFLVIFSVRVRVLVCYFIRNERSHSFNHFIIINTIDALSSPSENPITHILDNLILYHNSWMIHSGILVFFYSFFSFWIISIGLHTSPLMLSAALSNWLMSLTKKFYISDIAFFNICI